MSALDIFNYGDQQVRVVVIDGEPWFVLADLCGVLGLSNPSMVAQRLDAADLSRTEVRSGGQRREAAIVNEAGMYEVVLRSDKPEAVTFRRWITSDVLPTIRKTGSYSAAPALPKDYATALRELAATVEQNAALEAKVQEDAPKVLFADSVSTSQTAILVRELAVILRGNGVMTGEKRLYETLREDGFLIKREGTDYNMPTQRSMELGLFRVKETAITHSDGRVTISKTPKITGKGQAYFVQRYGVAA